MRLRSAVAFGALACAACAGVPETPESAAVAIRPPVVPSAPAVTTPPPAPNAGRALPVAPKAPELDALLVEFERLRRLPVSELAHEQDIARLSFTQSRSDAARIRLAMASSVPGSSPADEQRALDLLEPLVRTPDASLHGFAFLLSAFIQEQRRLAALAQGLQQNMQAQQQSNQALQQSVHGLQQKLDALRTLERSLSERGESAPRRR